MKSYIVPYKAFFAKMITAEMKIFGTEVFSQAVQPATFCRLTATNAAIKLYVKI